MNFRELAIVLVTLLFVSKMEARGRWSQGGWFVPDTRTDTPEKMSCNIIQPIFGTQATLRRIMNSKTDNYHCNSLAWKIYQVFDLSTHAIFIRYQSSNSANFQLGDIYVPHVEENTCFILQQTMSPCMNLNVEANKCSKTIKIVIKDSPMPDVLKLSELGNKNFEVLLFSIKCQWPFDKTWECIADVAKRLRDVRTTEIALMVGLCALSIICGALLYCCIDRYRKTTYEIECDGESELGSSSDNSLASCEEKDMDETEENIENLTENDENQKNGTKENNTKGTSTVTSEDNKQKKLEKAERRKREKQEQIAERKRNEFLATIF